eukprot:COSAG03_NODE_3219_length_2137_cov_84.679097_4_plen_112_part_00
MQKLSGDEAPEARTLLEWLNQHPEYEVFCGQRSKPQPKDGPNRQPARQAETQRETETQSETETQRETETEREERVAIWNKKLGRRLTGNVAPYRRNLEKYLRKHPDCEVSL